MNLSLDMHRLYIATLRPTVHAKPVLDNNDLLKYFIDVYGSFTTGRIADKEEMVKEIMKERNLKAEETIMIGDTIMDIFAGRKNNLLNNHYFFYFSLNVP